MDRNNDISSDTPQEGPALPQLPEGLQSALKRGHTLQIEGTNVVRVPFACASHAGPAARPDHWATLVIPFNRLVIPHPHRRRPDVRPPRFLIVLDSRQSSNALTSASEQVGVRKGAVALDCVPDGPTSSGWLRQQK